MAKNGQTKVLSNDELVTVLDEIEHHHYTAKNALIIEISFKLGLRAQEMSLLRIREIAAVNDEFPRGYKLKDVLVLPKSFTKGARAIAAIGNKVNERTSVRFTVAELITWSSRSLKKPGIRNSKRHDRLLPVYRGVRCSSLYYHDLIHAASGATIGYGIGDFHGSGAEHRT